MSVLPTLAHFSRGSGGVEGTERILWVSSTLSSPPPTRGPRDLGMPWGLGGPKKCICGLLTSPLPALLPQWMAPGLAFDHAWRWASEVGLGYDRGSLVTRSSTQVLLLPCLSLPIRSMGQLNQAILPSSWALGHCSDCTCFILSQRPATCPGLPILAEHGTLRSPE